MTKEISQIFLSDKSEELPRYIQQASKTIKVKYPEYNYEVYDLRIYFSDAISYVLKNKGLE